MITHNQLSSLLIISNQLSFKHINRIIDISINETNAILILGPRKSGKTTLLKKKFPKAKYYDLLKN